MGLIGPACTPGNGLSGRVLIGRGLTPNTKTHRSKHTTTAKTYASTIRFTGPPRTHRGKEHKPDTVAAAMAAGKRPDPFRTRKLSPPAPRVLPGRPGGRAGHRRTTHEKLGPLPSTGSGPTLLSPTPGPCPVQPDKASPGAFPCSGPAGPGHWPGRCPVQRDNTRLPHPCPVHWTGRRRQRGSHPRGNATLSKNAD